MPEEKRQAKRLKVNWNGRVLLPSGTLQGVSLLNVAISGAGIVFPHALPLSSVVLLEFHLPIGTTKQRVRAKTQVVHNTILSQNRGVHVGLRFVYLSDEGIAELASFLKNAF